MGFGTFMYEGKSYWMSEGNVRSCQFIQDEIETGKRKPQVLEEFLARNATYNAAPTEQTFASEQQPAQTMESVKEDAVVPTEPSVETPESESEAPKK